MIAAPRPGSLVSRASRAHPAFAAGTDTLEEIHKRGEGCAGAATSRAASPYAFEDPADHSRVIGFEVDIVDGLARRLGVTARFHHCSWSNLVPSLERGDFDIIANGLEDMPARRDAAAVAPVLRVAETQRSNAALRTDRSEALSGKRVGTLSQTYAHRLLGIARSISCSTKAEPNRISTSRPVASTRCCSTTSWPIASAAESRRSNACPAMSPAAPT